MDNKKRGVINILFITALLVVMLIACNKITEVNKEYKAINKTGITKEEYNKEKTRIYNIIHIEEEGIK